MFNGQPLRTKEIKEKLAKDLSGRTVDDALKAAVRNGDLDKIGNGLYQKPGQKPTENQTSQTSQPPIGIAKSAKFTQPFDGVEDGELFDEQLEIDVGETSDGDFGDSEPSEDRVLDAIWE